MDEGKPMGERKCKPCEGGVASYTPEESEGLLWQVPGWELMDGWLVREYVFKNYYETTAFVNAVAYIAHREDHHPDISFGYKKARVAYRTHSIGGLSENDFICAAKVNLLVVG